MGKDVNGNEKNKLLGDARQRRRKEDVSVKQQNHLIQVLKRRKNTKKVAEDKILAPKRRKDRKKVADDRILVLRRRKNHKKVGDDGILVTLTVPHIVLKNLPVAEAKGVKVGMSPNAVGTSPSAAETSPNAAETSPNVAETSLKNE